VLIAQITDTHIKPEGSLAYGHVDTSAFLVRLRHLLSPLPWTRPAGGAARGDETQGSGARKVVCVSTFQDTLDGRSFHIRFTPRDDAGQPWLAGPAAGEVAPMRFRVSIFAPTGGGRRRLSSW
jgi:hypothetical protein